MLKYLNSDMRNVFRYLPYGIIMGLIMAVVLGTINRLLVKKLKQPLPVMSGTCFFMYLMIMACITFLSRESGTRQGIDLELFSTWGINDRNNAYVIENILLFIPYGFVCAWFLKSARSFWVCTFYGIMTSTIIEYLQMMTERGYFQVDDILTNMLGSMIGYFIYRLLLHNRKTEEQKNAVVVVLLSLLTVTALLIRFI